MTWLDQRPELATLDGPTRAALLGLPLLDMAKGTVLFHAGEAAKGFVLVLEGRIDVFLTSSSGRGILLYAVQPGQSCVQSTLGLLGGEEYTGEAVAATKIKVVLVPRELFQGLISNSDGFRTLVFGSFAARMQGMMHLLGRVAFGRIEARLAAHLLSRARDNVVEATHQDLASAIGSAREVISRRLESFAADGWVATERGRVILKQLRPLQDLAAAADLPAL